MLSQSRGPLSFLEDVVRSLSNQMNFEDNPNAIGDRVVESQRLMQAMMNNDDQLYGAVNQNVLQDVVVGDMLMR